MGKNRQIILAAALLAVLTAAAYWRTLGNGFVYDDKQYIGDNPHVQNGLNGLDIRWALTSWYASNWHPLTWISHMLDSQVWKLHPPGHHLTNALLHTANTVLLFLLLWRISLPGPREQSPVADRRRGKHRSKASPTDPSPGPEASLVWRCAFAAALFGLHPLHVESVAWISERKDLLSAFFMIVALLAYARYVEKPSAGRYLAVAGLFVLGLMSKPMLVSLPFVLLILDYWPLRRIAPLRTLIAEKAPLLVLSAGSSVVTYMAQQAAGSMNMEVFPLGVRIANAAVSAAAYLWKMIAPVRLAALYPHPGATLSVWQVIGSTALLAGLTALVLMMRKERPYLAAGWMWYLITLAPVLGFVQVGSQAMADRYTYIPLIGVFAAVSWAAWSVKPVRAVETLAVLVVLACGIGTWHQTGYWQDDLTLCRHAIAVTRPNAIMHNNLGVALYDRGELDAAITEYLTGIGISSKYDTLHVNLGNALSDKGSIEDAEAEYILAIEANPRNAQAHNNLGTALAREKRTDEALDQFQQAIELQPDLAGAHSNMARTLLLAGRTDEAVAEYRIAIALDPENEEGYINLGEAFMAVGMTDEAAEEFERALRMRPDCCAALLDLGVLMINQGRTDAAIEHYRRALKADPKCAEAHHNMAIALYSKDDCAGAWREIALCRRYGLEPNREFLHALALEMPEPVGAR